METYEIKIEKNGVLVKNTKQSFKNKISAIRKARKNRDEKYTGAAIAISLLQGKKSIPIFTDKEINV